MEVGLRWTGYHIQAPLPRKGRNYSIISGIHTRSAKSKINHVRGESPHAHRPSRIRSPYHRTFRRASAAIHPATSVKQVKPGDDVGGIAPPWSSELFITK